MLPILALLAMGALLVHGADDCGAELKKYGSCMDKAYDEVTDDDWPPKKKVQMEIKKEIIKCFNSSGCKPPGFDNHGLPPQLPEAVQRLASLGALKIDFDKIRITMKAAMKCGKKLQKQIKPDIETCIQKKDSSLATFKLPKSKTTDSAETGSAEAVNGTAVETAGNATAAAGGNGTDTGSAEVVEKSGNDTAPAKPKAAPTKGKPVKGGKKGNATEDGGSAEKEVDVDGGNGTESSGNATHTIRRRDAGDMDMMEGDMMEEGMMDLHNVDDVFGYMLKQVMMAHKLLKKQIMISESIYNEETCPKDVQNKTRTCVENVIEKHTPEDYKCQTDFHDIMDLFESKQTLCDAKKTCGEKLSDTCKNVKKLVPTYGCDCIEDHLTNKWDKVMSTMTQCIETETGNKLETNPLILSGTMKNMAMKWLRTACKIVKTNMDEMDACSKEFNPMKVIMSFMVDMQEGSPVEHLPRLSFNP